MTESTDPRAPPFYEGRGFPLGKLSAQEFEGFVFGSLLCIAGVLGLRIDSKPSGSGDGGFDVQGTSLASGRLACVQCKRQEVPLDSTQVAKELAKVAATAALEGSDIGVHRFICTGGVRQKLRGRLREQSHDDLAADAADRLTSANDSELVVLRNQLRDRGMSPHDVARSYVLGLDSLVVWDSNEFDTALSSSWSEVLDVAGRYFKIASVVREHPRASFDRAAYISSRSAFTAIFEPSLIGAPIPEGIVVGAPSQLQTPVAEPRRIKAPQELAELKAGELCVLSGHGGVGKSTVLALLRSHCLRTKPDSTLPILISLASYVPGQLNEAIHRELGVTYGNWQSLPDDVLLLCDGLNECSFEHATHFLNELIPVLDRKRVSCVLATREAKSYRQIRLLHCPVACVRVQGITTVIVRRIADHELCEADVDAFVAAYRTLAHKSDSPQLWTPFAVRLALDLWKSKQALPSSLGEMIEVLLRSRCERDSEFSGLRIGPDVLLQFAGALAFQCLFLDRRLECPTLEAGKWIKSAKEICRDAFGVAELTDVQAIALLTDHELVSITSSGNFGFGHQLLAGALAGPILAKIWSHHRSSLGESLADDAWVFAARAIPANEMEGYLEATFDTDLMLGVRAAREVSSAFHPLAEKLLERAIAIDSPETVRGRGLLALGQLGSELAIARVRAVMADESDPLNYAAKMSLAAAGDLVYLDQVLVEVDRLKSAPMTITGGIVAIWDYAPFTVRLQLSRRRLSTCRPGDPVSESLRLVAYERRSDDAGSIETHLRAASNLPAFQAGLHALYATAPHRAEMVLKETLLETHDPGGRARILRTAALIGLNVDVRMAFECAVGDPVRAEPEAQTEFCFQQLVSDVLVKAELPQDLVSFVEKELPRSTGNRRSRLWQLACSFDSPRIAQYAATRLQMRDEDVGNACNYFIRRPLLARERKDFLVECCEDILAEKKNWFTWTLERAFALLGELGFTDKSIASLSGMIDRLARVRHAYEQDNLASLSTHDAALLHACEPKHRKYRLDEVATQLIPTAGRAKRFLDQNARLSLLRFDVHNSDVVAQLRDLISDIDDATLDREILKINDVWSQLATLLVVGTRGATATRIELLEAGLKRGHAHPAMMTQLEKIIASCWCEAICDMVMRTVAAIPTWSESDSQFFWDFARMVSQNLTPSCSPAIENALSFAHTSFGVRTLELWRDHALGRRIGLARIASA